MLLALIVFPMLAILAALGLIAIAPQCDHARYVLPAVRTIALVTVSVVAVAALFTL